MDGKKIRFALIGCGRIARKHIEALNKIEGAEVSAVCDITPERAKEYSKTHNIDWYVDYRKVLARDDIEIVSILTPSGTHASIAIDVAKSKKHLIIEKPMCLTLRDADAIIKECEKSRVKLFVVKQNRYNLPVRKLREALLKGRFGKLVLATARVRWCRRQQYYDQGRWRGSWKMDGGVLANQASHHIDLLQWLMGPVESVMAKTATRLVKIEAEDTGIAILKFKSGALGLVEGTTCTRPKDLEGSISILGEKGVVEIGGFAVNQIQQWSFEQRLAEDEEVLARYSQNPPDIYGFGHIEFIKEVISCLKNGNQFPIDGVEGRKSVELINAIYESAETGQEVFLKPNKDYKSKLCL